MAPCICFLTPRGCRQHRRGSNSYNHREGPPHCECKTRSVRGKGQAVRLACLLFFIVTLFAYFSFSARSLCVHPKPFQVRAESFRQRQRKSCLSARAALPQREEGHCFRASEAGEAWPHTSFAPPWPACRSLLHGRTMPTHSHSRPPSSMPQLHRPNWRRAVHHRCHRQQHQSRG